MNEGRIDYNKWARISVDDVIGSLKNIYESHPDSIFDELLFGSLMRLHKKFNLSFDLFVFEECEGFRLSDLQDVYWKELGRCSEWLKIGWHGRNIMQSKELRDDDISSFDRVYSLLANKLPKESISGVGCVHCYAGNDVLLKKMRERGIRTYFTSHYDSTKCYLLDSEDNDELIESGSLKKKDIWFLRRDICLDDFKNKSNEMLIKEYEAKSIRYPHKYQLMIFFHESEVEYIIDKLTSLLEWIPEYSHAFYLNASTIVGEYIYFTDLHTQCLYKIGINGGEITKLVKCPEWKWGMKFVSLIGYENEIWMFPREEDDIYIYNIESGLLEKLPIPHKALENGGLEKYRKPLMYNGEIWLVTPKSKIVERINPNKRKVTVYKKLPKGISFKNDVLDFSNISVNQNRILIFKKGANKNIEIDLQYDTIEINEIDTGNTFAEIANNKLYMSPLEKGGKIRIIDLINSKCKELEIPEYVWVDRVKWNSFWYVKDVDKYIVFMPLEANAILYISKDDEILRTIDIRNISYTSQDIDNNFGIFDIYEKGTYIYAPMFCGDSVLKINKSDMTVEVIKLEMRVKDRKRDMWFIEPNSIYNETKDYGLSDFFQSMNIKKSQWKEVIEV